MSKTNDNTGELKATASSVILTFYNDIQSLNHHYALYRAYLAEFNVIAKANFNIEALDESQKHKITDTLTNCRYYINKTTLMSKALLEIIVKDPKDRRKIVKEIETSQAKIEDQFIIVRDDMEEFTVAINKLLLLDVIKSVMISATELTNQAFS